MQRDWQRSIEIVSVEEGRKIDPNEEFHMKQKKVIAAGHICIDLTPIFPHGIKGEIGDIFIPGKMVEVLQPDVHTGGSVANTGLAMKLFGMDVSLMGKIGNDEFGQMIRNILQTYDAGDGIIIDPKTSTSYTVVLALPGIDRIFLHNPGANDTFSLQDIDFDRVQEADLFHFGYPSHMAKMYERNGAELTELFQRIKENECMTSLDLAPVDENGAASKENWEEILANTLPYVDFFLPSLDEICYMLDRKLYRSLQKRASGRDITEVVSVEEEVKPLAEKCLSMGCKFVMIKCGAAGFFYQAAGRKVFQEIEALTDLDFSSFYAVEGFERSFVPSAVVSGTGAGDTTIAAFLAAMLKGYPCKRCLQLAAATGASCVESVDALSGLHSFDRLIEKIDAGWEKQ